MYRESVINEFHQLKVFLNRSNKLANEITTFCFEIQETKKTSASEYRLFAFVQSDTEKHRIALTVRDKSRQWERSGLTPFKDFENFCAEALNTYESYKKGARPYALSHNQIIRLNDHISDIFLKLEFS